MLTASGACGRNKDDGSRWGRFSRRTPSLSNAVFHEGILPLCWERPPCSWGHYGVKQHHTHEPLFAPSRTTALRPRLLGKSCKASRTSGTFWSLPHQCDKPSPSGQPDAMPRNRFHDAMHRAHAPGARETRRGTCTHEANCVSASEHAAAHVCRGHYRAASVQLGSRGQAADEGQHQ